MAAAIMGLFHLLPHSPKFLDQLVKLTLQLEAVLHRCVREEEGSTEERVTFFIHTPTHQAATVMHCSSIRL